MPTLLLTLGEKEASYKSSPEKWSKKEILGHLIDGATNNHQRFVRVQFEDMPTIRYDQDKWNAHSYYQELPLSHLIQFWSIYNRHLLEVIKRIPQNFLVRKMGISDGQSVSLEEAIIDYVTHLEYHLRQLVVY